MEQQTIAIIGVGIMGRGIAENLAKAGFSIQLYTRNSDKIMDMKKPGMRVFQNASDAARGADCTILCLTTDESINAIFFTDILPYLSPKTIVLDFGTTSPEVTEKLSLACLERSIEFMDCPMTGSKLAAENGQLVLMVGGTEENLQRCDKIFAACSKQQIYCGNVGQGQKVKLCLNMVQAGMLQMYIEGLVLAKKSGVPYPIYQQVIESSAANSPLASFKLQQIVEEDTETHFSIKNMNKDLNHALQMALQNQATLPLSFSLKSIYDASLNYKMGEEDFSAVSKINFLMNQVGN
ncbi:MAG: NAD(P)-dependent oxidoreductase [Spirochaetota bacterium]